MQPTPSTPSTPRMHEIHPDDYSDITNVVRVGDVIRVERTFEDNPYDLHVMQMQVTSVRGERAFGQHGMIVLSQAGRPASSRERFFRVSRTG